MVTSKVWAITPIPGVNIDAPKETIKLLRQNTNVISHSASSQSRRSQMMITVTGYPYFSYCSNYTELQHR